MISKRLCDLKNSFHLSSPDGPDGMFTVVCYSYNKFYVRKLVFNCLLRMYHEVNTSLDVKSIYTKLFLAEKKTLNVVT